MTRIQTEAVSTLRAAEGDPMTVEGIAVPYGVVTRFAGREFGGSGEAFMPGAFRDSVAHWTSRSDGARMPFRPEHKARPVGSVVELADTPDGVMFRAQLFDTPAGRDYAQEVAAGLNGVSIEASAVDGAFRRSRDGTVLHRQARLHGIAGSLEPAYDGARVSLRDMEETMSDPETPAPPEPTPEPEPTPIRAERALVEREAVRAIGPEIVTLRAEAVYGRDATPLADGSHPSMFRDFVRMTESGDADARERFHRHQSMLTDIASRLERAGDVLSSEIPGAYPNVYLPGLLTPRILKGRPMGGFFNHFAITSAQPQIFAKVTTSTSVALQGAEGANPADSDLATTAVTTTPGLYGGSTNVSRQVLDGGSPAADTMIMNDLVEAYSQASETVIKTAVEGGATASGVAITAATPFAGTLANVVNYQVVRFGNGMDGAFIPPALYPVLLAQADTTGRPLMPLLNPMNSDGTTEPGAVSGSILNAPVFLSWASTVNVCVFARRNDYVIFESPIARFSYDNVTGPSAVKIGLWAYLGIGTRLGGLKVTAA